MTQPTLVLDLDGTLVDTAGDLVSTLNAVLATEGLPPVLFSDARAMVGRGARTMLSAALKRQGADVPTEELDRLTRDFIAHYRDHIADLSRPFPGSAEALDRLASEGWLLAVCTNKLEGLSRQLLRHLDLERRFMTIAGQDTFGVAKPDRLHLLKTIAAAGGDPLRAVMVGDSEIDVLAGKAANVPVVAVTFGYTTTPVQELGADRLIDSFAELPEAASALIATRG